MKFECSTVVPPCGRLPEMQVQYTSASRSSWVVMVTLEGSGHTASASGVTFDPILGISDLVGVESTQRLRGELDT